MKPLSLIHLTRAITLIPKAQEEEGQLELLAVYLAPVSVLLKARKDPSALDDCIAQAAELPPAQAAEHLSDFFTQFATYSGSVAGSLVATAEAMTERGTPTRDTSS